MDNQLSKFKLQKSRTMFFDYFTVDELPDSLPHEAVMKGLNYEEFFRKYTPAEKYIKDFKAGIIASLLIRYPDYIDDLYDHVLKKKPVSKFFMPHHANLYSAFMYLFPHLNRTLQELPTKLSGKKNIFEETKISKGKI